MITTIDRAGRLVIPKEIRRQAGLQPNMDLVVRCEDGRIEIEPAPLPVKLARKGRLLVASPRSTVPTLKAREVEETRRQIRRRGLVGR